MKVSRAQAIENRERVVAVAAALFRQHGLDGIGVADLMQQAGLTHGGFYKNFDSKDDLAAEACSRALVRSAERWTALADGVDRPLDALVARYLSAAHRDDPGGGCLYASLAPDAARRDGRLRRVFTDGLRPLVESLARMVPGRSAARKRERALATMAGLVGAVVLARVVDDPEFSDEILAAAAKTFGTTAPTPQAEDPA